MTKTNNIGRKFKVIGSTIIFTVVSDYMAGLPVGWIPAVTGQSLEFGKQINTRVADVVWLDDGR